MKMLHFRLAIVSLIALTGWIVLRRPSSPSDDLQPVSYTALVSHAPTAVAGDALANAVREWQGVTAVTYNAQSGLLVVAHTNRLSSDDLKRRLSPLTSATPEIKVFEPQGPQCPVPFEFIGMIPKMLLGLFLISAGILLFSIVRSRPSGLTQVT